MLTFVFLLYQFLNGFRIWADVPPETVVIGVGQTHTYSASKGPIHVSNGKLLKVTDKGASVLILAKQVGTAEVRFSGRRLIVQTLPPDDYWVYQKLTQALEGTRGLHVRVDSRRIQIVGRLLRIEDWRKIASLQIQERRFQFLAVPDPRLETAAREELNGRLNEHGLIALPWTWPARAFLNSETDAKAYERVLHPYGIEVELSPKTLAMEPLVKVNILVTEFRRKFFRKLGISWPAAAEAQVLPNPLWPGTGASPLTVSVQALEQSGVARILASPTLHCRSGKEAEFLAGGEFPLVLARRRHEASVVWKKYGVLLKIRPQADTRGRMSIALTTEISSIDPSSHANGVPGFLTNRIESHFDLPRSQTIALSGLIKKENGDSSEGLPGLHRVPILGALFGSQDFLENQTELVVFVTPEVVVMK